MLAITKLNLILLLGVISAQADDPTPKECTTALFHGLSTIMFNGMQKIQALMMEGKIDMYDFKPTCELAEMALNIATEEFYELGCGWGMAPGAFEDRLLSLLNKFHECPVSDSPKAEDVSYINVWIKMIIIFA